MKIFKLLFLILVLFILAILETSWQIIPDAFSPVFIFVVIKLFQNKYNQNSLYPWLISLIGGFFLDIYSTLPMGIYIISFLIITFILYKFILSEFGVSDHFHVFFVSLIIGLVFEISIVLLNYILFQIGFSNINLHFSFLYIINFLLLNSFTIFLLYGWNIRHKIKR